MDSYRLAQKIQEFLSTIGFDVEDNDENEFDAELSPEKKFKINVKRVVECKLEHSDHDE